MDKVEDVETVETEKPVEAPIGKDAFKAAREEIRARSQSQDQGTGEETPVVDDTPKPETPSQQPDKPADETPETGDPEDALLTPDEVSKLSAKELKLYQKAQKTFTQKTQKIAAERKEIEEFRKQFDEWKPLIDSLSNDPDAALRSIAEQRGMKFAETQDTPAVQPQTAETMAQLPEEWQFLKPIFDIFAKKIREDTVAEVRGELQPIKAHQEEAVSRAVAAETNAELEAFTAKYPDWKKQEPAMLALMQKFTPTGPVSNFEYMETFYKMVTAPTTQADQLKEAVQRINKVVENSEPVNAGVSTERVEHVMPSNLNESSTRFRAAAKAAARGERWVTRD